MIYFLCCCVCFFFLIAVPKKVFLGAPWLCEAQPWHKYFEKRKKHQPPSTKSLDPQGFFRISEWDFRKVLVAFVSSPRCWISNQCFGIYQSTWSPHQVTVTILKVFSGFFRSQEPSQEDLIIIKWCCPLQTAIEQICGHHHVLTGFWIWLLPFEIRSLEGFLLEFPRYHNEFCYDSLSLVKPKDFFRWIMSSHDICGTAFSRRIDLQLTDLQI